MTSQEPKAKRSKKEAAAASPNLCHALFGPSTSVGGSGGSGGFSGRSFPAAKPAPPGADAPGSDDDSSSAASASGGSSSNADSGKNNGTSTSSSEEDEEVQYVEPPSSPPRPKAPPSPCKPSPGSRAMSPPRRKKSAASAGAVAPSSPFDTKTSARFAAKAHQLRKRNLAGDIDVGIIGGNTTDSRGGGDGGDSAGFKAVYEEEKDSDGYGDMEEYYGMCDEDEGGYYGDDPEEVEEEEGPDGLTATERMYINREYEQVHLSEREWLIRQRQRRRLVCDKQAKMLSVCTEIVGGSLMPIEQWKNSSPSAVAAASAKRKKSAAASTAALPTDPYDLLNSDDEPEMMDRELVYRRERSLNLCSSIMEACGVLVIKNKPEINPVPKSSTSSAAGANANPMEIDSDVECLGVTAAQSERIIPSDLMEEMVIAAKQIEKELCDRLDAKGEKWRGEVGFIDDSVALGGDSSGGDEKKYDGVCIPQEEMKMPSRETLLSEERKKQSAAASRKASEMNFRYEEVASRCPGRIDSRYRMDRAPFNDPRVIANPVLLPIIKSMLGGENGGATLVYAGLIFSFPGSTDQPWHMDGEALFPEQLRTDLPPYACNVFIPLEDVTDELGPTEFIPGTHTYDRAEYINEELAQWTMIESRWTAAGTEKASMRMV